MDLSPWPGLRLVEEIAEGNRNEVWRGDLGGEAVAIRRSRRSAASLAWELALIERLGSLGFCVPTVRRTQDGKPSANGIVVQRWIDGTPPSSGDDWQIVATELQRLHAALPGYAQRPTCCAVYDLRQQRTSVDADLDAMPAVTAARILTILETFAADETSVIHGDPDPSNIRITSDGLVGLLDWDESRVDVTWHDLSNLGIQVLGDADHLRSMRLSHAWEAANGWVAEPEYARRRLSELDR